MTAKPVLFHVPGTLNTLPYLPVQEFIAIEWWQLFGIYDVRSIIYPASLLPSMQWSIDQGVGNLIDAINDTTGLFAISGESQGAAVCSIVYNEIRKPAGSLHSRQADFLGGFVAANPYRQAGHMFPGGVDPGGHGIAPSGDRLTGSGSEWWEFALAGDPICTNGDDTASALATAMWEWVVGDYNGSTNIVTAALAEFPGQPADLVTEIAKYLYSYFIDESLFHGTFGHLGYAFDTPIPGDSRTTYQIASDYLVSVMDGLPEPALDVGAVLPATLPFPLGGVDYDGLLQGIWDTTRAHKRDEEALRREPPLIRIWDAEYGLQHVVRNEYKAQFSWISNDTGPGQLEVPFDSPLAEWVNDPQGRMDRGEGRNVAITVDYCGARWSGLMDKFSVEQREDGDQVMVMDWLHDYEHVKWVSIWPNPWLPAAFQFPRAFVVGGPVTWLLKLALWVNSPIREHNPLITIPDDPLDFTSWFRALDMTTWHMVVKPESFLDAMESGVVWGLLFSRMGNWHDAAHVMLEDAELTVRCDRYLDGDPPPWEGANLRHGTLVIDIVDKSGVYVGTSNGGNIFDGIFRTVAEFAEDFIDSTAVLVTDTDVPPEYYTGNLKLTKPALPYVVFREGETSPIQSSAWINSPAKGVQVNTGGHSMPGVNETISATIQLVGDVVGNLVQIGSLGGTVDTLLKPLYEDTILAWWSVKSTERAQHSGWERLFEYFQENGGKAYTIGSLMVLRAGFWATRTVVSWKVNVIDGLPFLIGDRGLGHFFLDDRVGLVLKGDHKIHIDRCRKLDLAWAPEQPPEWQISIGDDRILQDPAQRAWGKIESMVAGLRDLGVW
jgi:hypothetical protein